MEKVFSDAVRSKFTEDFIETFNPYVVDSTGILYIGVMLYDLLADAEIPESNNHKAEVYLAEIEVSLAAIFNNFFTNVNKSINEILFEDINPEYLDKTIRLVAYESNPTIFLEDDSISFPSERFYGLFQNKKNKPEVIEEAFQSHFDLLGRLDKKYTPSENLFLSFIPITYQYLQKRILIYLTILGRSIEATNTRFKTLDFYKDESYVIQLLLQSQINYAASEHHLESIKSATAAIMARNMSHNIGSHVLVDLKIRSEPKLRNLLEYLKNRMEYLADISTSRASIVFDRNLYGDVISKFLPVSEDEAYTFDMELLLDNISGKTDIRSKQIALDSITYKSCTITPSSDIIVALPNDIYSCHAFYIIIENIIRNACKHSRIIRNENDKLEFTIDISDYNNEYYSISITDNLGERNNVTRQSSNFIGGLREFVHKNILSENNQLREGGWGFLEMKICAAYLIKYPLERIDLFNEHGKKVEFANRRYPPLLSLDFSEVAGRTYDLKYTIHFLKPKLALIISADSSFIGDINDNNQYKNNGIAVCYAKDFQRFGTDHEFIVIVNNCLEAVESLECDTNQRVVRVEESSFSDIRPDYLEIRNYLYSQYMQDIYEPKFINNGFSGSIGPDDIVFDDHGTWKKEHSEHNTSDYYYEPYNSQSFTKNLFISPYLNEKSETKKMLMKFEINEAARTKILLLDERIQNAILEKPPLAEQSMISIMESIKVFIPNKDQTDLGINCLNIGQTNEYIDQIVKDKEIDYLIIHLGILEKLSGSTIKDELKQWIQERITSTETQLRIIITSGRGLPSNLPENILYVPITMIFQYTITYPSKIALTKLLKSVRKYESP